MDINVRRPNRARAWGRKALWIVGTLVIASLCLMSSAFSLFALPVAYVGSYSDPEAEMTDLGMLFVLAILLAVCTLFWRRRVPWLPVAAGLVLTVVLQLDALLALVGMASLLGRRRGKSTALWTAAACVAAVWAGVRDGVRPRSHSATALVLDLGNEITAQPQQFIIAMVMTVVAGGAALAYGLIRRSRREVRDAEQRTRGEQRRSESLSTQVAQQDEREMLAREVHDALAHRLSLISLQSQSLGAAANSGDPAVTVAARALQNNAHQSLEDLRNLIGVLRNPPQTSVVEPDAPVPHNVGLADLTTLIDMSRKAGLQINSSIQFTDVGAASALLDKAAYRVVQESLTNVHKHAPQSVVWLWVTAEAGNGVLIRVVNTIADPGTLGGGALSESGAGAGVIGMRERTQMLGGTATIGPDDSGNFLVDVSLPWSGESADLPLPAKTA